MSVSSGKYDDTLIAEETGSTDGSGNFYSPWLKTGSALTAVSGFFPGSGANVTVQESYNAADTAINAVHALAVTSGNEFSGNCALTARYFRVRVETANADTYVLIVRATAILEVN